MHESSRERADRARERHQVKESQSFVKMVDRLALELAVEQNEAADIASSVICVLEQRIQRGAGRNLEAQLPERLRDMLFHCSLHVSEDPRDIDHDRFVSMVAEDLGVPETRAETYVRKVLEDISHQVSPEEIQDVLAELPSDLRALWPDGQADTRIRAQIGEKLAQQESIDPDKVSTLVENGVVMLVGEVASMEDKRGFERIVQSVEGVREIHDQLLVTSHEPSMTSAGLRVEAPNADPKAH